MTVDVCIQTPMTRLEDMHPLAEALAKSREPVKGPIRSPKLTQ